MQKLTELIKQNNHLRFFDADKKESLNVSEIFIDTEFLVSKNKKLAFLYIDNSLDSVWIFLNFMDSNHALVLLSPQLNSEFKTRLESIYKPYYIYDKKREHINNYKIYNLFDSVQVHYSNQSVKVNIHPLVKVLLSTSGSTGSPKFVKLSEKNIVSNAKSIIDYLPIMKEDITPLNLPIYYSYGLSILTTNSIAGCQIVCTNKDVLNKEFWLDFNKYKYTSLAGVPYLYEILNRIGFTKKQYPSLRYLTQAGGKLNIRLVEIFTNYSKQNNVEFYVMYGQTEATARMSYLDPKFLFEKISSIGKAIRDGSFTIDNDLGELHYTGPNVFGGYAEKIKDLNSYNENNILKTGDIAKVDNDGFFYITGRLKRFVKVFGERLNLDEVETLLKTNFPGKTFVCTGFYDKYLFVGVNDNSIDKKDVIDYLVLNLNLHPSVVKFRHLESIPLTVNGKVSYSKILEQYGTE